MEINEEEVCVAEVKEEIGIDGDQNEMRLFLTYQ